MTLRMYHMDWDDVIRAVAISRKGRLKGLICISHRIEELIC